MKLSFRYLALDHSFRCWLEDHLGFCLFCRLFYLLQKHDLIDSAIGTAVDFVAGFLVFDAAFPLNILLSNR